MSYPQSQASNATVGGQEIWHLNTLLAGPGDVYECDVALAALALGPQSDVARVRATYYDPLVPTVFSNSIVVAPSRASSGRLDSRPDEQYPLTSGKRGRILLTVDDIFDPSYRPVGFVVADDSIEIITPRLDVIGYLNAPPTLQPARADGEYLFNYFNNSVGPGDAWVLVPTYGRRQAFVDFTNWTAATAITLTVRGVNQTTRFNTATGISECLETPIIAAAVVAAAGGHLTGRINLANFGFFDNLIVGILGSSGPAALRITTTDQA